MMGVIVLISSALKNLYIDFYVALKELTAYIIAK